MAEGGGMGRPVQARVIGEPEHIEAVVEAMRRVLEIASVSPPRPGRKGDGHLSYLQVTGVRPMVGTNADGLSENQATPQRAAHEAAEALRQLNHRLDQIEAASDAYDIVGAVASCLGRMPQAIAGMEGWLIREDRAARLRRDNGGDVGQRLLRLRDYFGFAREYVDHAARQLQRAQGVLADVHGPVPPDEGEAR